MNVTSARATKPLPKAVSTTAPTGHTTDALAVQVRPTSAANDDATEVADARRVNPLWMITVALGAFFGAALLLLAST